jgi:calcineurin-like phosphoesterase family protein
MFTIDRKIWLIGDTHFDHSKMCEYCGRPENFNELIINNWNKLIAPTDLVYHLGDVYFGKKGNFQSCIESLPGVKILLKGNHDRERGQWYLNHGFAAVFDSVIVVIATKINNHTMRYQRILLSHKPMTIDVNYCLTNIHGHFHNNPLCKCEAELTSLVTWNHYLFSLEKTNYKPILLNNAIRDNLLVQGF